MEFHKENLLLHCRVCGKRLWKAKTKARVSYLCSEYKATLQQCFEIDTSQDDPSTPPPPNFASPATQSPKGHSKLVRKASITPTQWI